MLNMAGDGSRVRVGLRRSTYDGPGKASTTKLPTPSDAHMMGFSDLCINLSFRWNRGLWNGDDTG